MCAARRHNRFCPAQPYSSSGGGFTLLELLVVLIVLILALAAGIPLYTKTLRSAQAETAIHGLRAIRAREEARRSVTGQYYNGPGIVGAAAINPAPAGTSLSLNLTDGFYGYALFGTGVTFIALAWRLNPAVETIMLNQAGTWGGNSRFVPKANE